MKKYNFYADILQRGIKEKRSNNKKYLKERLKVALQNRLRNATMAESKNTALVHFLEMETWILLRQIDTAAVENHN